MFFLPYIAAYIAYYFLKGPINAPNRILSGISAHLPSLLQVFRVIHVVHLGLAVFSLTSVLRQYRNNRHELAGVRWHALVPWFALFALFLIPGAYLEYPADPWEHLARVNRWKEVASFETGLGWVYKQCTYFLTYSVLGSFSIGAQLRLLDVYQAVLSTVLSWQYYRLARSCGLTSRASMVFTFAQALLLGNDLFGFYRYYVFSSSLFAQLGAVAAIRIAIDLSNYFRPAGTDENSDAIQARRSFRPVLGVLALSIALAFATISHVQGLGIAGFGISAVVMWHLGKIGLRFLAVTVAILLFVNVGAMLLIPLNPSVELFFRTRGWINAWDGFDLFSYGSSAARRMILILGISGILNLVAGLFLWRRNRLVAWLTLTPVLALQLPLLTLPLLSFFAGQNPEGIQVFHRLFFAIPPGLALVVGGGAALDWMTKRFAEQSRGGESRFSAQAIPFGVLVMISALFVCGPAQYPYCNRLWNNWSMTPKDFAMTHVITNFYDDKDISPAVRRPDTIVVASAAVSNALQSYFPVRTLFSSQERLMHLPSPRTPAQDLVRTELAAQSQPPGVKIIRVPLGPTATYTPQSYAAYLSHHWNPAEVAFAATK